MNSYKTTRPMHGEFQVNTKRNSYWVRLKHGTIVDCAPTIREYFKYKTMIRLLGSLFRREGDYEVRQIVRENV